MADCAAARIRPSISTARRARATRSRSKPLRPACAFWPVAAMAGMVCRIACSTNGPMANCAACRRPRACFGSAGAAKRCWRGSKSATLALAAAIEDRAEALDRGGAAERRLRRKVVALSFAAAASLIVTAVIGLPALASRIIPFVPLAVDRKLGDEIDKNVRRFARYAASRRRLSPAARRRAKRPAAPRSTSSSASSKRSPRCRSRCMSRWCAAPSPTPWRCPAVTFTSTTG